MKLKLSDTYKVIPIGLRFKIVYRAKGMVVIETIRTSNWTMAKAICESKGEYISCEHIAERGDLEYLH